MLMYTSSHIVRIVLARSFKQALWIPMTERLCSGAFASLLLAAIQRNSIAQKDWQNFFFSTFPGPLSLTVVVLKRQRWQGNRRDASNDPASRRCARLQSSDQF